MVKAEWQSIFAKRFLVVVLVVITLIPSIYSVVFLGSMWDPYNKMSQLPVAVVNNDLQAEYDGQNLTLGSDLAEELKKSDALHFDEVTPSQGDVGLANGSYFMVLTIPQNFSHNATTVLSDNPELMQLDVSD